LTVIDKYWEKPTVAKEIRLVNALAGIWVAKTSCDMRQKRVSLRKAGSIGSASANHWMPGPFWATPAFFPQHLNNSATHTPPWGDILWGSPMVSMMVINQRNRSGHGNSRQQKTSLRWWLDVASAVALWSLAAETQVPRTLVPIPLDASTMAQAMNQPLEIALHCESARPDVVVVSRLRAQPFLASSKLWNDPREYLLGRRNGRVTTLGSK